MIASKGLYVAEYRLANGPFEVWIKWARGFWERRLLGTPMGAFAQYNLPTGPEFTPSDATIPQKDLDKVYRFVRQGGHIEPPADFFVVRFLSSP